VILGESGPFWVKNRHFQNCRKIRSYYALNAYFTVLNVQNDRTTHPGYYRTLLFSPQNPEFINDKSNTRTLSDILTISPSFGGEFSPALARVCKYTCPYARACAYTRVCVCVVQACVCTYTSWHALAVAHSSARVSLCMCACLYVPVCQCMHVVSCIA